MIHDDLIVGLCAGCSFHLPEALTLYDHDGNEVFTGKLELNLD